MTDAGFPATRRLRKRREFRDAQRAALRVPCRHFVVLVAPRDPSVVAEPAARLGLVASRKVGMAVHRNRGKRLVREWFRRRLHELPGQVELIVVLRPGVGALGLAEVEAELDGAMPRILRRAQQLQAPRQR